MTIIYTTKDGDILDQICHQYYNRTTKAVEQVLEDNPHLAKLEPILKANIKITLPEISTGQESKIIKLWE